MIKRLRKHDFPFPVVLAVVISLAAASSFFIVILLAEGR